MQKNPRATDFPQSTAIPAGPAQSGAGVRVVRSLDDLDQLAAAWDALAGGAGSPMQQFSWARACAESYRRRGDKLHVVTVGPAGRPTAIARLIRRRGLGRLEMLGGRELCQPTDFLYADRPASMAGRHPGQPGTADLPAPGPGRFAHDRRIAGVLSTEGLGAVPHRERLPVDPHRRQLAGARAEVRRQKALHLSTPASARRTAPVSFEVLSPSPVEVEPLLDEAYRVEAAG